MNKRALLIAFHFPPQAASSGIQRTLSFSKHLGRHGWEPLVLSAHPRAYQDQNPSQLASVPANLEVRRVFALDTKLHLGIAGRYPELLALPDRWISWCLGAVPAGLSLVRSHRPRVIWSTFPIATAHLIGLMLQRLTGLPWVADFRDPMIQPTYPESRMQRRFYHWIERQTIARCTTAVFTTHSAHASYRERYPAHAAKFTVIENGYDEDGFAQPAPPPVRTGRRRVTLLHSGALYQSGRDPSAFLAAVAMLKEAGQASAASLRVVLRAPDDIEAVTALVRRHGVDDIVEVEPPVPYREALAEMLDADGLMVFQGTPFNTQIPAKIYEYFRARKPILGLVDTGGETARVLRAGGFHALADMDHSEAIAPVLAKFIESIQAGSAHVASDELVAASSRTHRAGQLAHVLDQATLPARAGAAIKTTV
ncbi:glycosyltransferase [Massilia terrae]|uniref:Glycosyltransferase n=1 Tax=Massilia terrae TaxID=1811224 RepID=A0ABT2D0H0_9BURK|nr:glycosyltransferase [Massilia terrae]MCS0658940.1 glycosyltransferase [Massilia terrae]